MPQHRTHASGGCGVLQKPYTASANASQTSQLPATRTTHIVDDAELKYGSDKCVNKWHLLYAHITHAHCLRSRGIYDMALTLHAIWGLDFLVNGYLFL